MRPRARIACRAAAREGPHPRHGNIRTVDLTISTMGCLPMDIRRRLVLPVALVLIVSGCGTVPVTPLPSAHSTTPASATPSSSAPTASGAWLAVDLAQPSIVTVAPSLEPGYRCSPCHAPAVGQLFGVGPSTGGLIAVGVQQPPAQAIALSSTDGTHWIPLPGFSGATGTSAIAEASNGTRAVIVGLDHSGATAWASDGGAWTQAPSQADLTVPYAAGAMTSVTAFDDGFIAGGYRDDPLHARASAAVWRSNDGLAWNADGGSGIFGGGRIWGDRRQGRHGGRRRHERRSQLRPGGGLALDRGHGLAAREHRPRTRPARCSPWPSPRAPSSLSV